MSDDEVEYSPDKLVYMHGDLRLHIIQARSLPNLDQIAERLRCCFTGCNACGSQKTPNVSRRASTASVNFRRKTNTSDPYVAVVVPHATVARTRVISNTQNPKWDEHFSIPLAHAVQNLEFHVKDNDLFGAQQIGSVKIPATRLMSGESISGWFDILDDSGNPPKNNTALMVEMTFTSCESNPLYKCGIGGDPEGRGVRNTYFPVRKGGNVTLYQDAHVKEDYLPKIEMDKGEEFQHLSCWEDMCNAILEAHNFVYVVGWSLYHKVKLIREPTKPLPQGGDMTLGELLKYKSEEGVKVLLLIWDDKTSHHKCFINTEGVMATHDEETRRFFRNTSVICVLSPRYASSKLSFMKQQVVGTLFTHHQKCVILDTPAHDNFRKITAFLGGIDLCDGRYDTPEHRLFHGQNTIWKDDFHNPTWPSGHVAPRQPWHDLHCRIDGPAAHDVLINFEQRWRRATRWKKFAMSKKIKHWHGDSLLKIDRISWILTPPDSDRESSTTVVPRDDPTLRTSEEKDPETWHIQVFRSIDSGSVKGFPKTVAAAHSLNLICSKDLVVEQSIQTAYIQAIRSAQHFIYIENQYFLGSSYAWPSHTGAGAKNLIPMELALKIVSKIQAKERFAVYIVIPMWPEGEPKSAAMQEILFWQSQTMKMMYGIVADQLRKLQMIGSHPLDYLNFYCLGNREDISDAELLAFSENSNGSKVCDSTKNRRFMVYVHAKGMIVDDEYVIVGSANINQRSLAGSNDTEIAMGAYQPHQTWAEKKRPPRGQVYGYRMSLWAEHLDMLDDCFTQPQSLECVRKVNKVAEENWQRYTAEKFTTLQGHLLKYPLKINTDGTVESLPDQEIFPDVGGKILGAASSALPDVLTT